MLPSVYLAAEDEPGLAVGRKLIAEAEPLFVYREDNAHGYGRLKAKTPNFHQMGSRGLPVLMITDLDSRACPSSLIGEWLGRAPSSGFLFRICVREVEAWILAHRSALASFLKVPASRLSAIPESLPDPKAHLIAASQHSSNRKIRAGFKPAGTAAIGPEYNRLLCNFIRDHWSAEAAGPSSPSLERARRRLRTLANSVRNQTPSGI
jgi:hypothetical protein